MQHQNENDTNPEREKRIQHLKDHLHIVTRGKDEVALKEALSIIEEMQKQLEAADFYTRAAMHLHALKLTHFAIPEALRNNHEVAMQGGCEYGLSDIRRATKKKKFLRLF